MLQNLIEKRHLRKQAVRELWQYRNHWRVGEPLQNMRTLRNKYLAEFIPFFLVVSLLAGGAIFVLLPSTLPDQAEIIIQVLWPIWVATAAPMVSAQALALLASAPLALELADKYHKGFFEGAIFQTLAEQATETTSGASPAANPCISWIIAMAAVCAVSSYLLVIFSLLFGLALALMLAVGDVKATLDAVLQSVSPMKWLRGGMVAAFLGAVAGVSLVVFAWPGTHQLNTPEHTHKLALRSMIVCSVCVALSGVAISWLVGALGWHQ